MYINDESKGVRDGSSWYFNTSLFWGINRKVIKRGEKKKA